MKKNKIVKLNHKTDYNYELNAAINKLKKIDSVLFGSMIKLSTKGEWKEWSENQKDGELFNFNIEMFEEIPDKDINVLMDLREQIDSAIRDLTQANIG